MYKVESREKGRGNDGHRETGAALHRGRRLRRLRQLPDRPGDPGRLPHHNRIALESEILQGLDRHRRHDRDLYEEWRKERAKRAE